MQLFKNKKTGGKYRYLAIGVDCTNLRDGTPVVIYCPDDKENTIFVREEKEFHEKFEQIENENVG
jgi:hypothetical protein